MRIFLLICVFSIFAGLTSRPAEAQDVAYVQIEAHPNLGEARSRARAYGSIVTDINGFALGGRWYAITLGPYDAATATETLRRLRAEGLIPRDSYVSDGSNYRDRFWPLGAGAIAVPVAPTPDTVPDAAQAPGGSTSDQSAEIVAPEPVAVPEETRRQARRSEQLLSREARMELQRALQWFGFYTAAIDGSYGPGTRNSMAAWQAAAGVADVTGVLTTRQRARLLAEYATSQAELGLESVDVAEAGLSLTAPLGLVAFDRIEAPFVHYQPQDDSGVRLSLISQGGDEAALNGLFEILQTLEIVPPEGERSKTRDAFRIIGIEPDRTTQVFAKREAGHIFGYILSWPEAQDALAARALPEMDRTLMSSGPPLPPDAGFVPSEQSFDMVSGLEVRRPLRAASGFFVDTEGTVVTAAETIAGCGRVTLNRLHDAEVALTQDGVAVLRPLTGLAPVEVAALAPTDGRLRSPVSVGGFPFGGVLGAATLSFGTLEDVRDLEGDTGVLRLSLMVRDGDVGGPVLDRSGRVAGMLLPASGNASRALPADVTFAAKARTLGEVLSAAGVTARTSEETVALAPEDLAARAVGMTVLVSCWD
ncbi:Trypsin-like peptidase domain-containing protein [Jannaschia faecimaris]|uniref:Trypsin-like peptidase domain-containing protein n=1 Tax=Jannaschia faecimaris TaxID=1244108 RepID=A0A1H3QBS2_9RHOB|nr:serine protease [Jannaschia faecimaris]SDZ10710.1 Trypsin-like peptidase domain-containing protein [Jannaschia faecimaris]